MTILPDTDWRHDAELAALIDALEGGAGKVRFVGGAVRDTLLGMATKDIDLATSLLPEESCRRIAGAGFKAIPTGIAHGTITALLRMGPVEVTTLRRDVATDGRHATVAFTDRWQEDAARRDFTINALSADPSSGQVHDYFGGLADLSSGIVRFIGDPLQRIAEDHLRILRLFRFHARFGRGAPDADALAACAARANDLMALSRERIADELLKLLGGDNPAPTIALMVINGIFKPVIPEVDEAGAARLARLTDRERAAGIAADPVRRLGALLPSDPEVAVTVAQRLKLSKAMTRRLQQAAPPLVEPARALAYRYGTDVACDILLRHGGDYVQTDLGRFRGWQRPQLPIKGGDLVDRGISAGPAVAATLQAIERRWIAEDFPAADRIAAISSEEIDRTLRALKEH